MYDRLTADDIADAYASAMISPSKASHIVARIERAAKLPPRSLFLDTRVKRIAHARQDAMRDIRELLGWSYTQIGRYFERDHSTVMHGVKASLEREKERIKAMRFAEEAPEIGEGGAVTSLVQHLEAVPEPSGR